MANILAYWHAVELFDPQDIPRLPRPREARTRQPGTECVEAISLAAGEPLPAMPWQPGHLRSGEQPKQGRYGGVWRYTVYGGVLSFSKIRAALAQVLTYTEDEDYAGNRDPDGALFAFTVDENGILIDDTVELSSCAWATGRLHRPGPEAPDCLDGFGEVASKCELGLQRLLARPVSYLPWPSSGPADATRDWRASVIDALGAAAAGAVAALIGGLAPVVGGAISAGALAGAAGSVIGRVAQRAEHTEGEATPTAPAPPPGETTTASACGRPVQIHDIVAFAAHLLDIFGLPPGLVDPPSLQLRIVSAPVGRKRDGSLPEPTPVFLTSPVAPDLAHIRDKSGFGPALASYLRDSEQHEERIDLRDAREAVLVGVRPDAFPPARWPAEAGRPLVVGQQFAVNTVLDELAGHGLFSVNGPPGTGKTTLLRDLIAAIVVQRAAVLADLNLDSPKDAFTGKRRWTAPDGRRCTIKTLRRELTGFEIVVASSNNNAVENITKELPARAAIGAEWHSEAEYFAEQAEVFLGEPAWGMVAAPLGNANKRREFRERFWWGERGMHRLLQSLEGSPTPAAEWHAAVERFKQAMGEAADLAADRAAADTALRLPVSAAQVQIALEEAEAAAEEGRQAEESLTRAASVLDGLAQAIRVLQERMDEHQRSRPRGMLGLFGMGKKTAAWRQRGEELTAQGSYRGRQQQNARQEFDQLTLRVARARQRSTETARNAETLASRRTEGEERIRRARQAWGQAFPEGWTGLQQCKQELAAPWSDEEWTRARTRVFVAALSLHRAFIAGAAHTIRRNLLHLMAALAREPGAPPQRAELAAWQTLFLVVPVISTTFASCGRLFRQLGQESVGWVLVDEAGQALPQHAAGALWRAKRAVVVGDPFQLEPISQVPGEVQDRLRYMFGVDRCWLPRSTSAQGLADRSNRLGMFIDQDRGDGTAEKVWVGAPLRVHRRCERPMFDISNTIAYSGLMVYGTREVSFPGGSRPGYAPSSWVDVTGPSEGKWVPVQGGALTRILQRLVDNGVSLSRIYVISPFRDVVTGCRRHVRQELTGREVDDFINSRIGTVHIMQGKEADVVILVLGTDPSPTKGARDWAARPVNLLNVAVSRARRRLFVIGDPSEWGNAPNFRELGRALRHYSWHPR